MRHLIRLVAPAVAAVALALVGSSAAFAAATPSSVSIDADFCIPSGATRTCYDIDGTMYFLDTTAGSSVLVHKITRTTKYVNDEVTGEAHSVSTLRTAFASDGTVVIQSVVNTQSDLGDEPCTYRMVLRLVDYETVVYEGTGTCV